MFCIVQSKKAFFLTFRVLDLLPTQLRVVSVWAEEDCVSDRDNNEASWSSSVFLECFCLPRPPECIFVVVVVVCFWAHVQGKFTPALSWALMQPPTSMTNVPRPTCVVLSIDAASHVHDRCTQAYLHCTEYDAASNLHDRCTQAYLHCTEYDAASHAHDKCTQTYLHCPGHWCSLPCPAAPAPSGGSWQRPHAVGGGWSDRAPPGLPPCTAVTPQFSLPLHSNNRACRPVNVRWEKHHVYLSAIISFSPTLSEIGKEEKSETKMTAGVLKQDPNTENVGHANIVPSTGRKTT